MNVRELIEQLQEVDNKELPVTAWLDGALFTIEEMDELSDRVDLNIEEEPNEVRALREFFEDEFISAKDITWSKPYYKGHNLPLLEVTLKNKEVATCIVSSDTDNLKSIVEDSIQDLRDTMTGVEFEKNVTNYICGVDSSDSTEDIAEAVIDEYGYGHELATYDGKTHEVTIFVDGEKQTFYIMQIS